MDFVWRLFVCLVGRKLVKLSSVWNEYIVTLLPPENNIILVPVSTMIIVTQIFKGCWGGCRNYKELF